MKPIKQLLLTIAVLLCSATVNAYDFEVDGIYYNISSLEALTVEITHGYYYGKIVIPEDVTYKSKTLSVTSIEGSAFQNCSSLTSVTIPNSVTSIGDYAFYFTRLTSLIIPNSVTSIGRGAFNSCSSLTSVNIPDSMTSINDYAFQYCSSLTSVTIGNSVAIIGEKAFEGCNALSELLIAATVPPTVHIDNFSNSNYINTVVKVPEGSLAAYQAANVWKNFWSIEEFVTGIEDVQMDTRNTTSSIYTLQGVQVKEAKENLPDGIYIQNGKKFIVK